MNKEVTEKCIKGAGVVVGAEIPSLSCRSNREAQLTYYVATVTRKGEDLKHHDKHLKVTGNVTPVMEISPSCRLSRGKLET